MAYRLVLTTQVRDWLHELRTGDPVTRRLVAEAIDRLLDEGPVLGRPLVDRISGSQVHNLKELRPGSSGASEVRILFVFDPLRNAVLLIAGDKSGQWNQWYRHAIPLAEQWYEAYLKELP
ncbi:type II toxin-antitoxin system RelE/ParE family toxin [Nonomuraea lactucae]|uniref:type II toxin-antitoxin system RelE/ParE family toxin n=1 Tax=Nonomuraea lactucae TaxID=2249762 RepID=UPI001964C79E|nr:type II toxin-antitoxin system RelE/ParE family toxin [Nonomuraea lactucae]